MLPMVDLMNHSFSPTARIARGENGDIHVLAARNVPAGTELRFNYGQHDNSTLLLDYGFIDTANPHSVHRVPCVEQLFDMANEVAKVGEVAMQPWKAPFLSGHGMVAAGLRYEVNVAGEPARETPAELLGRFDGRLIAAARVLTAADEASLAVLPVEQLSSPDVVLPDNQWWAPSSPSLDPRQVHDSLPVSQRDRAACASVTLHSPPILRVLSAVGGQGGQQPPMARVRPCHECRKAADNGRGGHAAPSRCVTAGNNANCRRVSWRGQKRGHQACASPRSRLTAPGSGF